MKKYRMYFIQAQVAELGQGILQLAVDIEIKPEINSDTILEMSKKQAAHQATLMTKGVIIKPEEVGIISIDYLGDREEMAIIHQTDGSPKKE